MLEHVHALQVPLSDRVDRGDDREHGDDDAGDEERDPRPGREAGPASVQPQPAVQEECDRDEATADHERLERPGAPEVLGREHGTHGGRLADVQSAGADGARGCPAGADRAFHVHVPDAGEVGARPVDRADRAGEVGAVA